MWKPNVHKKKVHSEILDETVHVPMTMSVWRTIRKLGGLDEYLLRTSERNLDSQFGVALKRRVKERLAARGESARDMVFQARLAERAAVIEDRGLAHLAQKQA